MRHISMDKVENKNKKSIIEFVAIIGFKYPNPVWSIIF